MTDDGPSGTVRQTGPGPLVVLGLVGLLLGWAWRGQALRSGAASPTVSWLAIGAIWFVAAAVGLIAWHTWRTVRRQPLLLEAHQGLNRLVLGKTIDRVGSFVLGGCLGIAVSYLGVSGESASRSTWHALLAALGAAAATAASLLLERACRVPPPDEPDADPGH